jgi:CRISPR-associated protein Cmr1
MSGVVEIVARYRVVTPLFCGGADPAATAAELRLPSFKGVLRYWWRALAWSEYSETLDAIQAAENKLFGSGGAGAQRSRVVMQLGEVSTPAQLAKGSRLKDPRGNPLSPGACHGLIYLGYGLIDARSGELSRPCLIPRGNASFEFEVKLRCRGVEQRELALLRRALEIVGSVGGLGARSRRGYGALALVELGVEGASDWKPPTSIAELKERLVTLTVPTRHPLLPRYTAFSADSRHVLLQASEADDPLALLDRVGREMVRYRSYGRNETILADDNGHGVCAERKFTPDHHAMQRVAAGGGVQPPGFHPERIAFGLPHNYFFSKNQPGRQKARVGPGGGFDRRASPLFIHIHMCGALPVAVLSFLPAQFLPSNHRTIKVGGHQVPQAPEPQLYRPIHNFLDRFGGPNGKESFSQVEVHP